MSNVNCAHRYLSPCKILFLLVSLSIFMFQAENPVHAKSPGAGWIAKDEVALKMIENGFTKITGIEADTTGWSVKARLGSTIFIVHVDPHSGKITEQRKFSENDEDDEISIADNNISECNRNTGEYCDSPIDQPRDNCTIVTGKRCVSKSDAFFGSKRMY